MVHSCKYCGREFDTKQHKENHESTHEGNKHACDSCNKTFASAPSLKRHKYVHPEKINQNTSTMFSMCGSDFYCGECKTQFKRDQAREYNDHLDQHIKKADFGKHMYPSNKN